jgi:hypothetical protein
VLFPKTSIGELGWVAELEDSEGNCIALSQPLARRAIGKVRHTKKEPLPTVMNDESSPVELNLSLQQIMGYSQAITVA